MSLKRPPFPEWPAWVGFICFVLACWFVVQSRPRHEPWQARGYTTSVNVSEPPALVAAPPVTAFFDGPVDLSQASEDRIVRRLQRFLDRNEADRPVPVFRR